MKNRLFRLRMRSFLWCASFLLPHAAFAHTIVEVVKNPSAFDQQQVVITGEVANVVTRYGEAQSTTFDLLDPRGVTLAVLVSGIPHCKQGEVCRVQGLFVAQRRVVLPEKMEKISEGRYESTGILFRQKKSSGKPLGGNAPRGIYIPQ
jgi:hypothetical protein